MWQLSDVWYGSRTSAGSPVIYFVHRRSDVIDRRQRFFTPVVSWWPAVADLSRSMHSRWSCLECIGVVSNWMQSAVKFGQKLVYNRSTPASTTNHCIVDRRHYISQKPFSSILILWGRHTFNKQYRDASPRSICSVRSAASCWLPCSSQWRSLRLDFRNYVLIGLLTNLVHCLQSVKKAAPRWICKLWHFDHITNVLASLHWLRIPELVVYKIAILRFHVLLGITLTIHYTNLLMRHALRVNQRRGMAMTSIHWKINKFLTSV